jgi:site-specific DNA-methyltransferase (adenine-specific)
MTLRWHVEDAALHEGDALDVMTSWPDDRFDSIVTSPEYADQRNYTHKADRGPDTYAKRFTPFLAEMLRVVKPTGSLMLNLGVIMRKGEEHPYADETLAVARELGWKVLHRMVWHKKNPLPLSHPAYLTIAHEWVFWLSPTKDAYRGYDSDTRTPHAEGSIRRIDQPYLRSKDERYARRGKSNALHPDGARPTTVFSTAVGSRRGVKHPAPMSLDLAKQLVSLSTPPGGLVLDPFCGSGTTLLAARARGRLSVGIDLSGEYINEAIRRLRENPPKPEALFEEVLA